MPLHIARSGLRFLPAATFSTLPYLAKASIGNTAAKKYHFNRRSSVFADRGGVIVNSQIINRTEPDFCEAAAGACPRPTRPSGVPSVTLLSRVAQQMGVVFARCRAVAGLVFLLAALLAMPMPAASHPNGNTPHGEECDHDGGQPPPYDYCHSPEFPETRRTLTLDDTIELGTYFEDMLAEATDVDHEDRSNPTMVYELRDGNPGSPIPMDNDEGPWTERAWGCRSLRRQ